MSKNSKVLALKYRPQLFEDLIGQDIVAETILNSIKLNKVPNAYLFTGIRGVGKTTTARIIAKALNCSKGAENPCRENLCTNCESITDSNHIDILEMDAASKTGVDDVRDLIEFSRYGPTLAKHKIYIIDECHMLSKSAWAALLKTLEEPPKYSNGSLKFIFCTTEIKKVPITVVSRCQRFDLSRVKSIELLNFIKKIKDKENGNVSDDALKLIVKISEGSVRDALSLLDRALLSLEQNQELDLASAQKIFGYFDKSQLIDLFKLIFEGNEKKVLESYRYIYDQGIEPKIFINDFLELLYYFKNIDSLKIDGTNFFLNDSEFQLIKLIAKDLDTRTLILFWQFAIKTLSELDIVSNQNLSIEMFLIRLIHLKGISNISKIADNEELKNLNFKDDDKIIINSPSNEKKDLFDLKNKTIGQIKNVIQEKSSEQNIEDLKKNIDNEERPQAILIKSFDDLLKICTIKKEIKLKYELENNVNLVNFNNLRIEISFNEELEKDFIKNLSLKLNEWTNNRWIITLSKEKGELSKKEKEINLKKTLLEDTKKSLFYKKILKTFPDAELINIKNGENEDD
jgi:DNA polymerase-3 subunit gamma/tau